MSRIKSKRIEVRTATLEDVPAIQALSQSIFGEDGLSAKMIRAQINTFPEGQFVVGVDGQIHGHCATFIVEESHALQPHSWDEITGHGYISRHTPDGDFLYGLEIGVSNEHRGHRIGQRLYNARKRLCEDMDLKGIVFGGRLPGLMRNKKKIRDPALYVQAVQNKEVRDPVIGFHLRNGFEVLGILENFLPEDKDSGGHATHMVWYNPKCTDALERQTHVKALAREIVRVSCVQFQVRKVASFEEFINQVEYFVDVAADYTADFVVFPELFTLALLSAEEHKPNYAEAMRALSKYTQPFIDKMQDMAVSYNINIIGGTHPTIDDNGDLKNICNVFLRNGEVHQQTKIHPTPNERRWWTMQGGDDVDVIQTDCGPIGVLICYDTQFPEIARHLADQGALMLFAPFATDVRQGYLRVNNCAKARAIENQVYVATAGVVGNLPDVENMDIHYAESHIFTPCDFPFAPEGIAASAAPNTEMIIFADLNINDLLTARHSGTVRNFKDRRFDLYEVEWRKK